MNPSDVGARSELLAAVYLMDQGYEVYRAMSPGASVDLVALKDGQATRVEVKTGKAPIRAYEVIYPYADPARADLVAVVYQDRVYLTPATQRLAIQIRPRPGAANRGSEAIEVPMYPSEPL